MRSRRKIMSCCGKRLVQTTGTMAHIIKGNVNHLMHQLRLLPTDKCQAADSRLRICRDCESCTWMTWAEFWNWVDEHGGKRKFFTDIDDLTGWPWLPTQEYAGGRKLFCRVCKCWLPVKAFVKEEQCPQGHWKVTNCR